jgi:hypothetical protein
MSPSSSSLNVSILNELWDLNGACPYAVTHIGFCHQFTPQVETYSKVYLMIELFQLQSQMLGAYGNLVPT